MNNFSLKNTYSYILKSMVMFLLSFSKNTNSTETLNKKDISTNDIILLKIKIP